MLSPEVKKTLPLMCPDGSLLRPHAVRVSSFELLSRFAQNGVIICRLVVAHAPPIGGFRRGLRVRVTLDDLIIPLLRLGPSLMHEGNPRQPHFQLCAELGLRQVPFDPPPLYPVRIEYQHRGSPYRVEAVEVSGVFFYVSLKGQEVLVDEGRGFCVSVGLGLQPSTRASSGGGAEINQQRSL